MVARAWRSHFADLVAGLWRFFAAAMLPMVLPTGFAIGGLASECSGWVVGFCAGILWVTLFWPCCPQWLTPGSDGEEKTVARFTTVGFILNWYLVVDLFRFWFDSNGGDCSFLGSRGNPRVFPGPVQDLRRQVAMESLCGVVIFKSCKSLCAVCLPVCSAPSWPRSELEAPGSDNKFVWCCNF